MTIYIIKAITRYEIEADNIKEAQAYYLNGAWDVNDMTNEDAFELGYINNHNEYVDVTPQSKE